MKLDHDERAAFGLAGDREPLWWAAVLDHRPVASATLRAADRRFAPSRYRALFLDAVGGRAVLTPARHADLDVAAAPGADFGCAVASRVLRFVLDALPPGDVSVAWLGTHWPVVLRAGGVPAALMPLVCCGSRCTGAGRGRRWSERAGRLVDCACRDCSTAWPALERSARAELAAPIAGGGAP